MYATRLLLAGCTLFGATTSPVLGQTPLLEELRHMLPAPDDITRDIALGDVDLDGDLDALIGNKGGDRLYVNDGTGYFSWASLQFAPPWDDTFAVAFGDADGDGDLDAFAANTYPGQGSAYYLNDGSGVFGAPSPLSNIGSARAMSLGDLDGDGDLDVVLSSIFLRNDGSGSFPTWGSFPIIGYGSTEDIALADFDGDGDLDAWFGIVGQDNLCLNSGTAIFVNATPWIPAVSDITYAVTAGDVDADGDFEVVAGNVGPNRLYLNDGSATFALATGLLPTNSVVTNAVELGDVDGDGDLDLFFGNDGQDRLYLNDGAGSFTDATSSQLPTIGDATAAIALGDLDGDGDVDALIENATQNSLGASRLYLNDGAGVFTDVTAAFPASFDATPALALGDVEGDGDLDALVGNVGPLRLYRNLGSGAFTDATGQLPAITGWTQAAAFGDVDGDGDLDALIGVDSQNRLLLNDGAGVFTEASGQLPPMVTGTRALALGDVDGDGDLDLLLGNDHPLFTIGNQNRLYLNDGSGVFTDATAQLPALSDATRAVALGDVDGDGDLDALIGNVGPSQGVLDRLLLNDGAATFTDAASQLPPIVDHTQALALGDVDGDVDLDLLLGNSTDAGGALPNRLYLNDGSGAFSDATFQLPLFADDTLAVALGDVEGDGDLDAWIGNTLDPDRLYLNNGLGLFTFAPNHFTPSLDGTESIALADVDGDGDLDVLFGDTSRERLLLNLTRQLAWRGLPRVGRPLTLDLYGPPSASSLLAFSLGMANLPIPPLGTLRLDPTMELHEVLSSSLDAQGRASATYPVPANPALIGTTVYWQALVAAKLTNLEITTLTSH